LVNLFEFENIMLSSAHEDILARKYGSSRILDAGDWSALHPSPLYPPGKNLQYAILKGLVGPTSGLAPAGNRTPITQAFNLQSSQHIKSGINVG